MKKALKKVLGFMGIISLMLLSCSEFENCTIAEFIAIYAGLIGIVYASVRVCCKEDIEA